MNLNIKRNLIVLLFAFPFLFDFGLIGQPISTETLLNEMVDLKRLAEVSAHPYKYIQFSSYDRRSKNISEQGWFSNSDGFGNEPMPGFEKVLRAPGEDGIGEYLICEINKPGAILRLWTARINGQIRLFLDGESTPVYEGDAQSFFWETANKLSNRVVDQECSAVFRQFDATYFPIPFAKGCRIEWIGDIRKLHFYHVGIRIYEPPCEVVTFNPQEDGKYLPQLKRICGVLKDPGNYQKYATQEVLPIDFPVPEKSGTVLCTIKGSRAIEYLKLRVTGGDLNKILRQGILNIYFDGAPSPQVQSPLGDFFGAAPGINPYQSIPFSVLPDGTMECRFFMGFKDSVKIEIENNSSENIHVSGIVKHSGYQWEDGKSMYFRARWRVDHELTASDVTITDIPYLMAFGQGRVVGAATYLLNPTNAPKSHGNWWGEGDEKIFIDQDTFPSLFGTGSEDYYNYSWSSQEIFSYPYCGQPRNDGPGNRGFVSNYRWHISDDIPFYNRLAFYMELLHHGEVEHFSYARMVYLYSLPGLLDDHAPISADDTRELHLSAWSPIAFKGSDGYRFFNAEEVTTDKTNVSTDEDVLWADGKILMWVPSHKGDKLHFSIPNNIEGKENRLVITFACQPEGGKVSVFINRRLVKFGNKEVIDLYEPHHKVLRNYTSVPVTLDKGENEIVVEYVGEADGRKIGVDFIWVKD